LQPVEARRRLRKINRRRRRKLKKVILWAINRLAIIIWTGRKKNAARLQNHDGRGTWPRVRRTHTGTCDTPIAIIALVRLGPRKAARAIARIRKGIAVPKGLRRPRGAQCRPLCLGVRSHHGRARQTATTLCPNGRPFGPHTCPRAFTRRD